MDLTECDRCGTEYPEQWPGCPFCAANPKRGFKFREEDD